MNCEHCARTISKRAPFLIIALGRKTRLGYYPRSPELVFCSRKCAIRSLDGEGPAFLDRVPVGDHLPD